MKKKMLVSLITIFVLLSSINVYANEYSITPSNYETDVVFEYNQDEQKALENIPQIGCKAVYVADPYTGKVFYEKNSRESMYPASTTKILTALIVLENCELTEKAEVSQRSIDLVPEGYSNANLQVGEEVSVLDLLYALLIPSANEAANVLAEHVSGSVEAFAELCNKRAKELGCETLHFVNPNGIHNENHYCSAYDLYLIAKECQKYDAFNEIVKTKSYTLPSTAKFSGNRTMKNTNELLLPGTYYYANCTGIKTGHTTPAGNCLVASSSYNNINLISVVLGGGTNSKGLNERFYDTTQLFEFVYQNYSVKNIVNNNDVFATIDVKKATKETSSLDVIVGDDISTIVPNNFDKDNLIIDISMDDGITAPIEKNQVLGQITFKADGLNYTTNLIASHEVEKIPYWIYNSIIAGIMLTFFIICVILIKKKSKRKIRHYS